MVFVPKKEWEDFQGGVAIKACEGRGLSLKNTDCKIIAGATNHVCAPTISKHCVGAQRGFVQSRNFIHNIIELDACARAWPLLFQPALATLLCLFDFSTAFPSVSHKFLKLVLRKYKMPKGLINLIEA
eukprot:5372698-Karenia_brevis.AAC.1